MTASAQVVLDVAPRHRIWSGSSPVGRDASNGIATRDQPAAWVVVAAEYQADADAALYLRRHGFDCRQFLVQTWRPALGRRPSGWGTEAAFPGYLIVRLFPEDELHHLRADSRNGIAGWLHAVGAPDTPAVLPDLAMWTLLSLAEANAWTTERSLLGRIGDRGILALVPKPSEMFPDITGAELEIADHPYLAGFRGECLRSGPERVVVLLRLLGGERRVTVGRDAVRVLR